MATLSDFDAVEYLDSPEMIAAYLRTAFEENDAALIRTALNDVARAKGMTAMAAESSITRQALYKALGPNGNMTLETLLNVLRAMGVRLSISG